MMRIAAEMAQQGILLKTNAPRVQCKVFEDNIIAVRKSYRTFDIDEIMLSFAMSTIEIFVRAFMLC